jgi:hypothetical protein
VQGLDWSWQGIFVNGLLISNHQGRLPETPQSIIRENRMILHLVLKFGPPDLAGLIQWEFSAN